MCTVGNPSYIEFPGITIRNGVEKIRGEDFDDITDWGEGGEFIRTVGTALTKLRNGERGRILLESVCDLLINQKKKITIEPAAELGGQLGSGWDANAFLVKWSPKEHNDKEDWDQLNGVPPFIILGHELIHALHTLTNTSDYKYDPKTNNAIEEARTI